MESKERKNFQNDQKKQTEEFPVEAYMIKKSYNKQEKINQE